MTKPNPKRGLRATDGWSWKPNSTLPASKQPLNARLTVGWLVGMMASPHKKTITCTENISTGRLNCACEKESLYSCRVDTIYFQHETFVPIVENERCIFNADVAKNLHTLPRVPRWQCGDCNSWSSGLPDYYGKPATEAEERKGILFWKVSMTMVHYYLYMESWFPYEIMLGINDFGASLRGSGKQVLWESTL